MTKSSSFQNTESQSISSVFITGASGFIGRKLSEKYRDLGITVKGMDLKANLDLDVVAGNITQPNEWQEHAKGCDLFVHTASVVSLAASWDDYREISVNATRLALDAAIAAGAKRFIYFSSIAALGWRFKHEMTEKDSVVIGEEYRYGVGKGAGEHVVLAAHAAKEIECTIIRPGDVYGPGSRAWITVPYEACKSGVFFLPNKGEGLFSPVYIDDLLDGIMLAAQSPKASGQIFHITGTESVTCMDFFSNHQRWSGRSTTIKTAPLSVLSAITYCLWKFNVLFNRSGEMTPDAMYMFSRKAGYSIEKAKTLLGYEPKMSLDEGLRLSEEWLKETS